MIPWAVSVLIGHGGTWKNELGVGIKDAEEGTHVVKHMRRPHPYALDPASGIDELVRDMCRSLHRLIQTPFNRHTGRQLEKVCSPWVDIEVEVTPFRHVSSVATAGYLLTMRERVTGLVEVPSVSPVPR